MSKRILVGITGALATLGVLRAMRTAASPVVLGVVLVLVTPLIADDAPSPRDEFTWAQFKPGASIVFEQSETTADNTITRGYRLTLTEFRNGRPDVRLASERDGAFKGDSPYVQIYGRSPAEMGMTAGEPIDETIQIAGRDLRCKRITHVLDDATKDRHFELTQWTTDQVTVPLRTLGVPGPTLAIMPDVVKATLRTRQRDASASHELLVTAFDVEVAIGDRTIRAVRETHKMTATQKLGTINGVVETERLLSAAVPGHLVRATKRVKIEGQPPQSGEMRIVEFHTPADAEPAP